MSRTRADGRWKQLEAEVLPPTLTDLLDRCVQRAPDEVALHCFEDEPPVTYRELQHRVGRASALLARLGVVYGDRVGVVLGNVTLFPTLWFAVARLGAVIVPINPESTSSELDFLATDSGLSLLVADVAVIDMVAGSQTRARLGDAAIVVARGEGQSVGRPLCEAALEAEGDPVPQPAAVTPGTIVNFQYTSGTTGWPKACELSHEYWVLIGHAMSATLGHPTRVLSDSPFFYMETPAFVVTAMAVAGVTLIPRRPSIRKFLGWMHDHDVEYAWFPAPLLATPPSPLDRGHRWKVASVDGLPPEQVQEIEARFGIVAREMYAMTETGIGTVAALDDSEAAARGSIGVPGPHREVVVRSPDGDETPIGEVGELCVRGRGLFRGYYGRPEVNAELLSADGWFRTGDLGSVDADGRFYYRGRLKDMVRRSGENVAAVEVEHAVGLVPGVVEAAVVPVPDARRGEEVKVYVLLREGLTSADVPPTAITEAAARKLAAFKVPRYVAYVEEFPRTGSGKIAKRQLIDAAEDLAAGSFDRAEHRWRPGVEPRT